MKFKMNNVATAVALGMGVSAVGMQTAQSDQILFPTLTSSETVTSIVSVINTDTVDVNELHYIYWFKTVDGSVNGGNRSECEEFNFNSGTSTNDIVTFDVMGGSSEANADGVFFEPTSSVSYSDMAGLRNVTKPVRSFLLVEDIDDSDFDEELFGEAIILEFATGAAWGYRAYNPLTTVGFDFSNSEERDGEVIKGHGTANSNDKVAFLPPSDFTTLFFVTPVSENQNQGNLTTDIEFEVASTASLGTTRGVFDRDEQPISGSVRQRVTCVGAVNLETMLTQPALAAIANTGGWANIEVIAPGTGDNQVDEAVIFKLEFGETTSFGGGAGGVFNNAIQLLDGDD